MRWINIAFICFQCTTEEKEISFTTLKQLVEHRDNTHKQSESASKDVSSAPPQLDSSPVKEEEVYNRLPQKPIVLKYKFEGSCPDDGRDVDTILIPVQEQEMAVSYCSNCKKQLTTQLVIPIARQMSVAPPPKQEEKIVETINLDDPLQKVLIKGTQELYIPHLRRKRGRPSKKK